MDNQDKELYDALAIIEGYVYYNRDSYIADKVREIFFDIFYQEIKEIKEILKRAETEEEEEED